MRKLQKKAPNALKLLHAELKSAPAVRHEEGTSGGGERNGGLGMRGGPEFDPLDATRKQRDGLSGALPRR